MNTLKVTTTTRHASVTAARALLLAWTLGACASERAPLERADPPGDVPASAGASAAESAENAGAASSNAGAPPTSTDSSGGANADDVSGKPGEMQLFLLFGQSNMEGAPKSDGGAEDAVENPRVKVLGYGDFGDRKWNEWSTAKPPLHRSWAGVGPGDYFGKAMAKAWPTQTIGLIPCAISGVDIDYFRKGVVSTRRSDFKIPPDDSYQGAYEMVIERVEVAQQSGVVRGMLFHQGESDSGNATWLGKVKEVVADLRSDLGLTEAVPFVAGELLYSGCCAGHNSIVNQIPANVPNSFVVSAADLSELDDPYNAHFDLAAQRLFGQRYAEVMLQALGAK